MLRSRSARRRTAARVGTKVGHERWLGAAVVAALGVVATLTPAAAAAPEACTQDQAGLLYFAADDGVRGTELWATDGTGEGTRMVADVHPGGSSDPLRIGVLDGVLYFFADDGVHGSEPWRSDGTEEGTWLLADLIASGKGSAPPRAQPSVVEAARLLFPARKKNGRYTGWSTDGTTEGTRREPIETSPPSTAGSLRVFVDPVSAREHVVSARDYVVERPSDTGWRTWAGAGLPDVKVFTYELDLPGRGLVPVTILRHKLLFYADTGDGYALWASDGTATGTKRIASIGPHGDDGWYEVPEPLAFVHGRAILLAQDERGQALWATDGTGPGTQRLARLGWRPTEHMSWVVPVVLEGRVFLEARSPGAGREVWVTNGTTRGTRRLTDLPRGSSPVDLVALDGRVLIGVETARLRAQLWVTDGTHRGTRLLRSFPPRPSFWTAPVFLKGASRGALVVHPLRVRAPSTGASTTDGFGLSVSDGTVRGTSRVEGIELPGMEGGGPEEQAWQVGALRDIFAPITMDGYLYFRHWSDASGAGAGLWRSDGTASGTERVSPIVPSSFLAAITPEATCAQEDPGRARTGR